MNGVNEDTIVNFEGARGGAAADILNGDADNNVFRGNGGIDVIDGNGGNDSADFFGKTASSPSPWRLAERRSTPSSAA